MGDISASNNFIVNFIFSLTWFPHLFSQFIECFKCNFLQLLPSEMKLWVQDICRIWRFPVHQRRIWTTSCLKSYHSKLKIIIFVLSKFTLKSAFSQKDSSLLRIIWRLFADLEKIPRSSAYKRQFIYLSLSIMSVELVVFRNFGRSHR